MCVFLIGMYCLITCFSSLIFMVMISPSPRLFLGNDLFLDDSIHSVLRVLLKLYCRDGVQATLNFSVPVPGLASFEELYVSTKKMSLDLSLIGSIFLKFRYSSLLDQFAAVSYGNHLFASYVLLPLQQRFSVHFRRLVWSEHSSIIRIFSLPLTEVRPKNLMFLVCMFSLFKSFSGSCGY